MLYREHLSDAIIKRDQALAKDLSIMSTPTTFVEGRRFVGAGNRGCNGPVTRARPRWRADNCLNRASMPSEEYDTDQALRSFLLQRTRTSTKQPSRSPKRVIPTRNACWRSCISLEWACLRMDQRLYSGISARPSQGHAVALNNLGTIYLKGVVGVPPDRETGVKYYRQAHACRFGAMDLKDIEAPGA